MIVKMLTLCVALLLGLVSNQAFAATEPPDLLLRNVKLIDLDATDAQWRDGMAVLVRDGRIAVVGPVDDIPETGSVTVVDGKGRYLLPGLVDLHVHLWDQAALGAYLAHGITTIRNASGMPFHLDLAKRIQAGDVPGPRLLTTGPILNSHGPNEQPNHQFVTTEAEARAAVRWQYDAGFRHLKTYSNLTHEAWIGIQAEAAALGMTLMGHTPEGVREIGMPREKPFKIPFDTFLDASFISIEHVESIVWHALRNRHDANAAMKLAKRIAASGTPVDPTLVAFRNLLHVAETEGEYLHRPGTEMMNPLIVALETPNYERWTNEAVEPNAKAFDFYKQVTRMFADAGVLLVAGTDAGIFTNIPGVSLIDELELYAEAGLSPAQILRIATLNSAIALGEDTDRGSIAEGKVGDMVLTAADPMADISTLRHPVLVVAEGRPYDRAALDALLAEAARPDLERTMANALAGLQAQGSDVSILNGL
ncbi:MAG: amidohydrolase family protein [Rhodobacteraceae bacterium]|nr:amidohydrolase family protein [Paracoccaceae bacterium]